MNQAPSPLVFQTFIAGLPGLENVLAAEARALGLSEVTVLPGGITARADWPGLWRANLGLRTASHVLLRVAEFRAMHLAQLDKRARRIDWAGLIKAGSAVRVEAVSRKSRIYHQGAASARVLASILDTTGAVAATDESPAPQRVLVRIEDDLCTISLDLSGAPLHRRGLKERTGKAPLRETLAAAFLTHMGFDGDMPVLDPLCGSGTFPITAAEMARGLWPGRARRFAFEDLAGFDRAAFERLKAKMQPRETRYHGFGSDRDQGAVMAATANAEASGVGDICQFHTAPVSALMRPEGPAGLVMVNPPYGGRIGNKKLLYGLYASLGTVLKTQFSGWRVGLVTSEQALAHATGLPFEPPGPPIPHGSLKIRLFQTAALP